MRNLIKFLLVVLLVPVCARAEIQHVSVLWNSTICLEACAQAVAQRFRKMDGAASVSVSQPAGRADIDWKPDRPFSYFDIRDAMSWVGLSINKLRVVAKGKIFHDEKNFTLISSGDGSRFILLGQLNPTLGMYTERFNVASYHLSQDTIDKLVKAEKDGSSVTVEGPIFEPQRSPPLWLIIEQMTVNAK